MTDGEANQTPCYRCGGRIDYEFTRRNHLHRLAGTVHHIQELWQGGDPLDPANLAPAHRGCNTIMSNQLRTALRHGQAARRRARPPVPSSRNW